MGDNKIELDRCPWCKAGENFIFVVLLRDRQYQAECHCGACGPEESTKAKAASEWNRVSRLRFRRER